MPTPWGAVKFLFAWIATNWAWGVPAVGGSAVLTALVGWLLSAVASIPLPLLLLLLLGIFLLALRPMALLVARFEQQIGLEWPPERPASQNDRAGAPDGRSAGPLFDPYAIITNLAALDLSGLSEPESFMMVTLNVRNVSGHPVTITGVRGRIQCAGAECNSTATVEREPVRLGSSDRLTPCVVRQPLADGMMNRIVLAGDPLRISLSGLQWVGSVDLPRGSVPLERCYIHEDFLVKGPFREKKDAGTLFRLTTTFLSSEYFDSDGAPKPT